MLGGAKSKLHRQTPYKHKWAQMKDGDLWEHVAELVRERGPESVAITKVKGHATQQMVDEGKVEEKKKRGTTKQTKPRKQERRRVKEGCSILQKRTHGGMGCTGSSWLGSSSTS